MRSNNAVLQPPGPTSAAVATSQENNDFETDQLFSAVVNPVLPVTSANTKPIDSIGKSQPIVISPRAVGQHTVNDVQLIVHKTLREANRRKSNVVISGLQESSSVSDAELFLSLCENNLGFKPQISPNGCRRLGNANSDPTKHRRLLIKLCSEQSASDIIRASRDLRNRRIPMLLIISTLTLIYLDKKRSWPLNIAKDDELPKLFLDPHHMDLSRDLRLSDLCLALQSLDQFIVSKELHSMDLFLDLHPMEQFLRRLPLLSSTSTRYCLQEKLALL